MLGVVSMANEHCLGATLSLKAASWSSRPVRDQHRRTASGREPRCSDATHLNRDNRVHQVGSLHGILGRGPLSSRMTNPAVQGTLARLSAGSLAALGLLLAMSACNGGSSAAPGGTSGATGGNSGSGGLGGPGSGGSPGSGSGGLHGAGSGGLGGPGSGG